MTYSRYRHLAIERTKPVLINAQLGGGYLLASFQDFLRLAPVLKIQMRS